VHACSTLADARSPTQRHSLNAFPQANTKQSKSKSNMHSSPFSMEWTFNPSLVMMMEK